MRSRIRRLCSQEQTWLDLIKLAADMNFLTLPIGKRAPEVVNAVVEVPYGCANKYEYDKSLHMFRLDRPLYASVHYPGEYGFIPSTLSPDGDALDIVILVTDATFPGCLVETRPVGVLEMIDQGLPDQKILAVAKASPTHTEIHRHSDLAPHVLREIEHFFSVYKELEGKHTEVKGWRGVSEARRLIQRGHRHFAERNRGQKEN
jgi:inorganic pyrophosphatase